MTHRFNRTLLISALALVSSSAWAQNTGFALDRYEPSERGSDWFANESLDLRGHLRPALGIVGDWAYKPLVLYKDDEEYAKIVEHQVFAHVGGSLILWDRLRLGANLPLLVYNKGESGSSTNTSFSTDDSATIGDARLGADVRLVGAYGDAATLAAGVQVFLPTGKQDSFAGDEKVRVMPRLMLAGDVGSLAYAARVGFHYRGLQDDFAGEAFGSELTFGAAAGVRLLDEKLIVGPEVYGSTVVSDGGGGAFAKKTTPFEVVVGGKYRVTPDWRVGAAAGPGLTRGVGAPEVRVLASIEWFPEPAKQPVAHGPGDRDKDGIIDDADACPDLAGVASEDPAKNGCPPPADRDNDGILDSVDACPDQPGPANMDAAKNGCPLPADRDKDGVIDPEDACPDEPGVATGDPKTNGCPAPKDTDGDTILDPVDACPDKAGKPDPDPKKNGCPAARIESGQIRIIDRIEFATNSDKIVGAKSDEVLQAVLKILKEHPEVTKVSVEGHTDNKGNAGYNKGLSQRRAAAVVRWLTKNGIEAKRLTSAGFGQAKPIDTNDSEEGRQNNRRVEFHIREMDGKPVDTKQVKE